MCLCTSGIVHVNASLHLEVCLLVKSMAEQRDRAVRVQLNFLQRVSECVQQQQQQSSSRAAEQQSSSAAAMTMRRQQAESAVEPVSQSCCCCPVIGLGVVFTVCGTVSRKSSSGPFHREAKQRRTNPDLSTVEGSSSSSSSSDSSSSTAVKSSAG